MSADELSVQFASDNYAGIAPEALEAFVRANAGHAAAYGNDRWTREAADACRMCDNAAIKRLYGSASYSELTAQAGNDAARRSDDVDYQWETSDAR